MEKQIDSKSAIERHVGSTPTQGTILFLRVNPAR